MVRRFKNFKKLIMLILGTLLIPILTGNLVFANIGNSFVDNIANNISETFFLVKTITILTSDGLPLKNGYVQVYSLDMNENVFLGKTDENGQVQIKITYNKSDIKNLFRSKNVSVIDLHYIIFAGNDTEMAVEGMTVSYLIANDKNLDLLTDNEILRKDTDIPKKIETVKFKDIKNFKISENAKEANKIPATNSLYLNDGAVITPNEVPSWFLVSEKDLGDRETTVAYVNICDGVQSSFDMSKSSYGVVKLSGSSVISVSYSSGSTITARNESAEGTYPGTHREYRTGFEFYEQKWMDNYGNVMTVLVPRQWNGYINKYDSYEPMCTPAHISDAYRLGYITIQGGQSIEVSYSNGLTIQGAAKIPSIFSNIIYSVDATYTSSTNSALTRKFTTKYKTYLVYPSTSKTYVIPH
ncbi:hypothetical protein M2349_002422 [Caldanaerobacter subterraneus subsp. tengcongensis MB4]|uniref:Uncharacterized protein n=1 Tax=Caldanaerobacter subterraneus subsp. tengcongensis (strain DSM 15242 / JCM 11007 / NBRC 100824 / MB4) TaxID=273068 RepID=Q8R6R0_CALS4|nr:hypothetical protein [Caldanaerobacter subterraneus]AAM25844.1 hypothetical protein TTE2730 [Caldanaerobacter subterraneus subsp. tengcongensis MB4]MCS3917281.1 hypothetical protein [Caldanaerobacter subterraneus subsp. tengcongensis MB4]